MYLMQCVHFAMGTGCCGGASEREVVKLMAVASGTTAAMAAIQIELAVRAGRIERRYHP